MPKTLYLCGPINGCTDEQATGWREHVKTIWWGPTLDPMRRDYRGKEDAEFRDIVELDKIDIQRSDAVLVSFDKPSVGTSMEVFFAWQIGKPVVVVAAPGITISPWLRYHSHRIVNTYEDGVIAANELAVR